MKNWGWAVAFIEAEEIVMKSEQYVYPHTARMGLKAFLRHRLESDISVPENTIRVCIFSGSYDLGAGGPFFQPKITIWEYLLRKRE